MNQGETDTTLIRVPIAIHDTSGVLAGGCSPTTGQLKTSVNGVTWTDAAGALVNFGDEGYYYQGVVGDAAVEGILCVCVVGAPGFRTEMAFEQVVGTGNAVRIPFVVYDTSGVLLTGWSPSSGDLKTSDDGVSFVNAPGAFSEMGFGGYFYVHSSSTDGFVMLRAETDSIITTLAYGSKMTLAPTPVPPPIPPSPIPSPIPTSSPEYVDHVEAALDRLPLQFRRP